jgi:hypothetical protein
VARLAQGWHIGWLRCSVCGYEWNAHVQTEDLPRVGPFLESIIGKGKFKAPCPQCGKMGELQELVGG